MKDRINDTILTFTSKQHFSMFS